MPWFKTKLQNTFYTSSILYSVYTVPGRGAHCMLRLSKPSRWQCWTKKGIVDTGYSVEHKFGTSSLVKIYLHALTKKGFGRFCISDVLRCKDCLYSRKRYMDDRIKLLKHRVPQLPTLVCSLNCLPIFPKFLLRRGRMSNIFNSVGPRVITE